MKKLITLLFGFIIISKFGFAQKNNFGFIIGSNCSDFLSKNKGRNFTTKSLPGTGYLVGLTYSNKLNNKWRLITGFNRVIKNSRYKIIGAKYIDTNKVGEPVGNTKQGIFQIPLVFTYVQNNHLNFYTGIYIGVVWDNIYNENPYFVGTKENEDVYPSYNNWDNGIQFGVSYKLNHFNVNIDYSRSLNASVVMNLANQFYNTITLSLNYIIKKQTL